MEEKRRNKNAIRSRKMIVNAYIELISEMPVEKVTVTKIVERADLNRSTFYAHFTCPQDVMVSIQNEVVDSFLALMNEIPLGRFLKDPLPLLMRVADFINERKEYYKILISSDRTLGFLEEFKEIIINRMLEDKETIALAKNPAAIQTNLRFFVGGYISLFHDWIAGKLNMSLYDMTEMTSKTIAAGVSTFL
jgi:AcrR family transcriptional regulator